MRKFETATEYRRDLNKRRMAAGLCVRCGKPVDDDCTTCSVCRRYKNQYVKQNKERKKNENERSKKMKNKKTIDEVNAMAKERGMSYGLFVALQEQIKINNTMPKL